MDLDLRKLRYFLAVADRLHFGRAAACRPADSARTRPALVNRILDWPHTRN